MRFGGRDAWTPGRESGVPEFTFPKRYLSCEQVQWAAVLNLTYHLHWIRQHKDMLQAQETAVLAVAALLSFLICAGTFWLFPDLELLAAGKRTRWTRFRGAALATLEAITVGLIVSLLTAIVKG